jgi:hypothetical protein
MTHLRQRPLWIAVAVGLALNAISGCQTYFLETGQTLPSGYYLHHAPQYFPPTPQFPLPREEANLELANTQANAGQLPPR